jgi:hypothetical protein
MHTAHPVGAVGEGRYVRRTPREDTHTSWTQCGDISPCFASQDAVRGDDERECWLDHATIRRGREAIRWTMPYAWMSHKPG